MSHKPPTGLPLDGAISAYLEKVIGSIINRHLREVTTPKMPVGNWPALMLV